MDSNKIIHDLQRRFSEPLPEFYRRRIIVWYDEDREFEQQLDEIKIDGVKVVALTGTNNFAVKKLISIDEPYTNILLYDPCSYKKADDNWLLDVELYSEEFRADMLAIWMDEMGLPSIPSMRQQVKNYKKFFHAKQRRDRIANQGKKPTSAVQLNRAVMAAIAGLKDGKPVEILHQTLCAGLDQEENKIYQDMVGYGADAAFWEMVSQGTGYQAENPTLRDLFKHILLATFASVYKAEIPTVWDVFSTERNRAFCYDFINHWIYSPEREILHGQAKRVEQEISAEDFFLRRPMEDILEIECFPCIHEMILYKIMTNISNDIIDVDKIRNVIEKRRVCAWYGEYESIYEGLRQIANMQEFFLNHSDGFHLAKAREIWQAYTEDYYRMDQYYRLLHLHHEHYLLHFNERLHDLYGVAVDKAEKLYNTWFLEPLSHNWTTVAGDELTDHGKVWEISSQTDFYRRYVQSAENRVFVVISDAMRYEVAAELYGELQKESQSTVKISSQQAIFPTITKFGMAALLPHKSIELDVEAGNVKVLVDGQSSGSSYRDSILKTKNKDSVAVKYSDLITMKRADRSALAKGKQVVYIYHDTIDEASHQNDTAIFESCSTAVDELRNLVRVMVNDMGALNIVLTADHGFLYTYSPLAESDKLEKSDFKSRIIEIGRRFVLMQKGNNPDYLLPVALQTEDSDVKAYAAKGNVRIKSGGGMKFVHGGISLQEMVVPIIQFRHIKTGTKEYQRHKARYDTRPVEVSLLTASHMVSNRNFKLEFYQSEAIAANRSATEYTVYFVDNHDTVVSDMQKIIADRSSENAQNRIFTVGFSLKDMKFHSQESYYLIVADSKGQETHREEFEFSIAYDEDEVLENDYFA